MREGTGAGRAAAHLTPVASRAPASIAGWKRLLCSLFFLRLCLAFSSRLRVSLCQLDVLAQTVQESQASSSFLLTSSLKMKCLFLKPADFSHDVCGDTVFARCSLVSQSSLADFSPPLLLTELSLALMSYCVFSFISIKALHFHKQVVRNCNLVKNSVLKLETTLLRNTTSHSRMHASDGLPA